MILLFVVACSTTPSPSAETIERDETALIASTGDTSAVTPRPSVPPNILVLLSDDQGIDSVGVYEAHPRPPPTPHIDQLATEGLRFNNAWSYPVCSPSRAAMLTGRLGRRTGTGNTYSFLGKKELPVTEVIVPRMLESAVLPWATAAIGKWHLGAYNGDSSIDHPIALGFDSFSGTVSNLSDIVTFDGQVPNYFHWEHIHDGVVEKNDTYITTYEADEALRLMETLPEPWFIYLAFHAPHSPFDVPPEHLTPTLDASPTDPKPMRYPLVVEALDQEIGRLLSGMGDQRERTLVVFASDNGTPEDATLAPWLGTRAKNSPYEGGVHVPLIVAGPGVPAGTQTDALVHLVDIFSTVADVAGVNVSTLSAPIDGISLLPLLADPGGAWPRQIMHTELFGPNGAGPYTVDWRMTRSNRWKLIQVGPHVPALVYDLATSPIEVGAPLNLGDLAESERIEVNDLVTAHNGFFEALIEEGH